MSSRDDRRDRGGRDRRDRDRDRDRKMEDEEDNGDAFGEFQDALKEHTQSKKRKEPSTGDKKSLNPFARESLEVARKQDADVSNIKPKFLTKKQREEKALKALDARRQAQQKARDELETQRMEFELASRSRRSSDRRSVKERDLERRKEEAERKARQEERNSIAVHKQQEKYLKQLKEDYLGKKKVKKTVIPPSQKFKFSFDWEASEDTSVELNSLYDTKHKVALLYGRGFIGGVDRREQRKQNTFYDDLIKNRDDQDGLALLRDQEKVREREEREKKKNSALSAINRHWSEKRLEQMEDRDWRIFNEDHMISVRGVDVPRPLRFWKEARLPEPIQMALVTCGYREPTSLQRQTIPVALALKDFIAIADHGPGHAAALLIPLLTKIGRLPRVGVGEMRKLGPYAVVLAPTPEAVRHLEAEAKKFLQGYTTRCVGLVDTPTNVAASLAEQLAVMKEGAEIIIGTPNRIADFMSRQCLVLSQAHTVYLDETDKLLATPAQDAKVRSILDAMPASDAGPEAKEGALTRQTVILAAGMPAAVEALAKRYLANPIFVAIADSGEGARGVKQTIAWLADDAAKVVQLLSILASDEEAGGILVYVATKQTCETITSALEDKGTVGVLHGSIEKEESTATIAAFESGAIKALVVSEKAAVQVEELQGIEHVIMFDIGTDIEKYSTRIGKSASGEAKKGRATALLSEENHAIFFDLKALLKDCGQVIPQQLNVHEASKTRGAAAAYAAKQVNK